MYAIILIENKKDRTRAMDTLSNNIANNFSRLREVFN
jgi:hypothetical protein